MKTLQVQFRENRSRISLDELRKYNGQWVAFSEDGLRIVASGEELEEAAKRVEAAGAELKDVLFERIEFDSNEIFIGGAENL
jgi:hypothetical protein